MKKLLSLFAVVVMATACALAQTRPIAGQVRDEKDNPVPFATIKVRGTDRAVVADTAGNFTIQAQSGDVLQISAAGLQMREFTVNNETTISAVLAPQQNLQEVVVTALGIRRKRNEVPYAAQQISGEDVTKTRSSNFLNNLSGKVSGLDIRQTNTMGGSVNVVIRGTKSITGDNQALFVVDGVPYNNANTNTANQRTGRGGYDYGNTASDINPDDIESVTVLKGAAASALYGSQGANGVILITTKKGSRGLGITINSGITVGRVDKSTFAKYQNEYGAGYGAFYGPNEDQYFNEMDVNGDGIPDLVAPVHEDASYGGRFDPNLMVYQWDAFDPSSPFYRTARPWLAAGNSPVEFFETAVSSNQSILLSGGSDRGTFKLGYTRTDDKGILPNSKVTKDLASLAATYNITEKLIAGATVNYSGIEGRGRFGTGYDDKNLMTNFRQWWQVNVDVKEQREAYFREKKNITWNMKATDPFAIIPNFWDNPYFTRYENYQTDNRNRYFGNINLNYKITDWLNILGRVSLDSYDELQEERQAVGSVTVSSYTRFNRSYKETNYDLLMNFDRDVSTDFNLKALLGTNIRKQRTQSIRASTNGGLIVPHVYALSNSLNAPTAPVEFDGTREIRGIFAGATLTWQQMLTLDATVRRDQSSTLPENNNVYYYPSVSAGFTFSRLLQDVPWLTYGKVRANYAQVGNDAPIFSVNDVYAVVPPFGSNPQSSVTGTKNNPDLKPERTNSVEVGLEMAFFKNRLGFDISYYNAETVDQIVPVVVSTSTGYNSQFLNAGTIENKGVELTVFGTPVQSQDFSWNVTLNWSRNRNSVVELFQGAENLILADFQGGISLNATVGQPYVTIRGSNFIFTGGQKTVGANGRYLTSTTSNEVIGNPNPDWIGGINNTFKYKNFSLSFLIDTRQGGEVFSLDMYYGLATGLYPETAGNNDLGNPSRATLTQGGGVIMPGVTADGKTNTIRVTNNYGTYGYARNPAAAFVYDASFIKLREVVLTYALPKATMSRLAPFKAIEFSLIGRNLWIIDKKVPYADPEETISSGNLQGYQSGAYPTTKLLTFNLRLRF